MFRLGLGLGLGLFGVFMRMFMVCMYWYFCLCIGWIDIAVCNWTNVDVARLIRWYVVKDTLCDIEYLQKR